MWSIWIAPLISYLLGSVSFSYWVGKYLKGIDIREHGSGNAGATNVLRILGKGPACIVFLLDALKGVLSLWIGLLMNPNDNIVLLCGLMAIIGHNWPVFSGFRGGKGIATTFGVTLFLFFKVAILSLICAVVVVLITRYVSLGSLVYVLSLMILLIVLPSYTIADVVLAVIMFILAVLRHKGNIERVRQGTERKITLS